MAAIAWETPRSEAKARACTEGTVFLDFFARVLRESPQNVRAPQAQCWHAVADYKQTGSRTP